MSLFSGVLTSIILQTSQNASFINPLLGGALHLFYKNCFPIHQPQHLSNLTDNEVPFQTECGHLSRGYCSAGPACFLGVRTGKEVRGHLLLNLASLIPGNKQRDDETGLMDGALQGGKMPGKLIRSDNFLQQI